MITSSSQVERRIIFLVLIIAVVFPLIVPLGWKTEVTPHVQMAYDLIDSVKEGETAIVSFDYDPATATELQPMAYSVIKHAFAKNQKVIAMALWPQGVQMADEAFSKILMKYPDKKYGIDYVNLGYKPGGMVTLQAMGKSIKTVFPSDSRATSLDELPMMKGLISLKNIAYVVSLSAGDPGIKQWIMAAHDMYNVKVTGGTTAVSAPGFLPYINQQNQLYGLLGGLKSAAEYEVLLGVTGPATTKMDAQSVAHILILVFVLIGNIKAWRKRHPKALENGA